MQQSDTLSDINSNLEKLSRFFPRTYFIDVKRVASVIPLKKVNTPGSDGPSHTTISLFSPDSQDLKVDGEAVSISGRVYFNEPSESEESILSQTQKDILNCIFTRHHDGFIRQRRLVNLITSDAYFTAPFFMQLLGEYVIEIIQIIDASMNEKRTEQFSTFAKENPKYWMTIKGRIASYWDAYYRGPGTWKIVQYVGRQVEKKIDRSIRNLTSRST